MQLYKAEISPNASFCSPLQSDTLFGAFCWSYKYIYGEDKLLEFIQLCKQQKPPVIFSNVFPHNAVPVPLGLNILQKDFIHVGSKEEGKKRYQENKKLKNAEYITIETFQALNASITDCSQLKVEIKKKEEVESGIMRNMVNRNSGTVEKGVDNAGNLFEQVEYHTKLGIVFDVYILSSLEAECLKSVLELMFTLGIGANKSIGKGTFNLQSLELCNIFQKPTNANGVMFLSNAIPKENDPVNGFYKVFVKNSKLDREYAIGSYPFKKPLLYLSSGAVFYDTEIKQFYGRCVCNVANVEGVNDIIVSGFTIAIPLHIPNQQEEAITC